MTTISIVIQFRIFRYFISIESFPDAFFLNLVFMHGFHAWLSVSLFRWHFLHLYCEHKSFKLFYKAFYLFSVHLSFVRRWFVFFGVFPAVKFCFLLGDMVEVISKNFGRFDLYHEMMFYVCSSMWSVNTKLRKSSAFCVFWIWFLEAAHFGNEALMNTLIVIAFKSIF